MLVLNVDVNISEQYLQSLQGILERSHHFGNRNHLQPIKKIRMKLKYCFLLMLQKHWIVKRLIQAVYWR